MTRTSSKAHALFEALRFDRAYRDFLGARATAPQACTCCERTYTRADWEALSFVGNQEGGERMLQLRNCPCGTTLSIEVPNRMPIISLAQSY